MNVQQLEPGLWRWTATHPDWTPEEGGTDGWAPEVGCVYCETEGGIVLVDPLVPADRPEAARFWSALDRDVERDGRPPSVLLTVHWHARSADEVAERYAGARVFAAAGTHADVGPHTRVTDWFAPGGPLPGRIEAYPTPSHAEVVYRLPACAALVTGDVLLGDGQGGVRLLPEGWLGDGVTRESVRDALLPLLDLPIERILVSHGEPVLADGHDALARALR